MIASSENEGENISFNEMIVDDFGIHVIECGKNDVAGGVDAGMNYLSSKGFKPYYIYGDRFGKGNEHVPARAYEKAFGEIVDFEKEWGKEFDYIYVPCGTGGTLGGIARGSVKYGSRAGIVGISISSRTCERACEALAESVENSAEALEKVELTVDYNCGGYGIKAERVLDKISEMMRLNGIPMDSTYSGKAYRGMLDHIRKNNITGKNILFIHTGGTALYYDDLLSRHLKGKRC